MRVDLIHPGELGPDEIGTWHAMQRATPALDNPFLSPEYAIAAGRFRPNSRVAILTEGSAVIGFFPFERRWFDGGVPISGWLSHCQGLVHAQDAEWDTSELLRGCKLAAWKFDNLIPDQTPFQRYHSAISQAPMVDLSDGFDGYYAKLRVRAPRFCRELERKRRKLGREVGELRLLNDSRDTKLLRLLATWKSGQYHRTKHFDRFHQPWVIEMFETLLATRTDYLAGLLSVLYAGDQPVAIQFGLRAGTLLVGWFTGYDVRLSKYSPGLIQIRHMTEQLATAGVVKLHMGKGAKPYTGNLRNSDVFIAEGTVTGRSMLGTAHRIRSATSRWALDTVRTHPALHHAADELLRRTGVSTHTYGRVLYLPARSRRGV
jgi:CelD/BcsL family acetyltransferase involved in cellulose biosynthesis